MIQIELRQLEADLPHFPEQVAKGYVLTVCKNGVPIAELHPCEPVPEPRRRPLGLAKGLVEIPPSFFDPLPDDLLADFNAQGSAKEEGAPVAGRHLSA